MCGQERVAPAILGRRASLYLWGIFAVGLERDVVWGTRSNRDHVVAGPAVYVLNSKNLPAA